MASRMATYFVPGAGIDREVITTDICRYLGPDALVKPGQYLDPKRGPNAQPESGFFVTAYRSLTTDQLTDIKADSARWIAERSRNQQNNRQTSGGISPMREMEKSRQSNMTPDRYAASATRARQQDQPSPYSSSAMPAYGGPPAPQAPIQQYDQYGRPIPLQQPSQYPQDYNQGNQNYGYQQGQTVPYGIVPPTGGRSQPSQTYAQQPTGYPPQGRGMDTQYGSIPDPRQQTYSSSYGGSLGRSQPMAPQQQYPTSGQPLDPYAYPQRGQQDDTAMGDYDDYADTGSPAPYSSTPAQPQPQPSSRDRTHRSERDRERDRSDRDRDEPSRRSKHSRR